MKSAFSPAPRGPSLRTLARGTLVWCALLLCACPSSTPSRSADAGGRADTGPQGDVLGDTAEDGSLDSEGDESVSDVSSDPQDATEDTGSDTGVDQGVAHIGVSRVAATPAGATVRTQRYQLHLTVGTPVQAVERASEGHRAVIGVTAPLRKSR